jgi:predicted signal transduction protein with EAL and GGDEF domain
LTSINKPHQLTGNKYTSSTSIGITLFSAHESEAEELLKQADIAMYQAKADGRKVLRFFDPRMQSTITARAELEQELNQAIELQQFQLYYQIQVDSALHTIGAEVLIRWIHPERGLIPPLDFIPLAEQNGTINVWQQDVRTRDLTLSVNVSAKQLGQSNFITQVIESIEQHKINPKYLKLELTESVLQDDIEDIITKMKVLADIGVQFSLDDFGTGYSSLQYLKQLPLYQLKIDKTFVDDLVSNSNDQAIVRTIIAMAHSLGLNVIAEGVETKEQQQRLLTEGCSDYQGYLFGKPLPIEEFEALLETLTNNQTSYKKSGA